MELCTDCRFWERHGTSADWGTCHRKYAVNVPAPLFDVEPVTNDPFAAAEGATLQTHQRFGCVEHMAADPRVGEVWYRLKPRGGWRRVQVVDVLPDRIYYRGFVGKSQTGRKNSMCLDCWHSEFSKEPPS